MSYKKMVTVFVDIIGYKNTTNFANKYELHRLFHEEVAIHEKRQQEISHVVYDRQVFGFSDCAYFFFYYKDGIEEKRKDDTKLAYIASYNVSLTILRLMSRGYLARGGICIGDVFIDELGFFGPGVERAHEIESKEAQFPRLQFDFELGKRVYDWDHDISNKDPIAIELFAEFPFVSEADENSYFVNPFDVLQRTAEVSVDGEILTLDSVKSAILRRVESDLNEYANNERVVEKLVWIRDYVCSKTFLLKSEFKNSSFGFING